MLKRLQQGKKAGYLIGVLFIIFLSACKGPVQIPESASEPFHFKKLMILPFQDMARIYGENVTVQCRLCGNIFTTGKVDEGADSILTAHLVSLIHKMNDIELIPMSQAKGALSRILSGLEKELPEQELLIEIGRALEADAIMVGKVYRFIERDGTQYSAKSAASVAFDIVLIRVIDGSRVWNGHFTETQRSLFEDLFQFKKFFKRKGKWITAEEMALTGLSELLETFPAP